MYVEENAAGVGRRCGIVFRPSRVGEQALHIRRNGLRLRFRGRLGAVKVPIAGLIAGADGAPLKAEISIEINARPRIGTVGRIVILTPKDSLLRPFAPIRIGVQHQVDFMLVQQPGGVGVDSIIINHLFGKAGGQFGRGIFARVERTGDEQLWLRPRDGRVGQFQYHQVGAAHVGRLLPRLPDRGPGGQLGEGVDDRLGARVSLFDGTVTRISGNGPGRVLLRGQLRSLPGGLSRDGGRAGRIGKRLVRDDPQAGTA